jgi:hypothetical protein
MLWCLYCGQVHACASWLEGHSMKHSKQSMMTATLLPKDAERLWHYFSETHSVRSKYQWFLMQHPRLLAISVEFKKQWEMK